MSNSCPVCRVPMVAFEYEGVEVDHCLQCRGTWLDAGELEQIAHLAGVSGQGSVAYQLEASTSRRKLDRKCPRCGKRLELLEIGIDEDRIMIDRCPRNEGFWFDRGELRSLLRASTSNPADEAVRKFLGDLFHHELEQATKGE